MSNIFEIMGTFSRYVHVLDMNDIGKCRFSIAKKQRNNIAIPRRNCIISSGWKNETTIWMRWRKPLQEIESPPLRDSSKARCYSHLTTGDPFEAGCQTHCA